MSKSKTMVYHTMTKRISPKKQEWQNHNKYQYKRKCLAESNYLKNNHREKWWNVENIKKFVNPKSPSYWYKIGKWEVKCQMWFWHKNGYQSEENHIWN